MLRAGHFAPRALHLPGIDGPRYRRLLSGKEVQGHQVFPTAAGSTAFACSAAKAVWKSVPAAMPVASSPAAARQAGSPAPAPVLSPVASSVALGSMAGPDYMWTGSTRSLLPALKPGQSAEVPLQVRLHHQYGIKCLCGHGPAFA